MVKIPQKKCPLKGERTNLTARDTEIQFSQSRKAQRTLKTEYPGIRHFPNAMG